MTVRAILTGATTLIGAEVLQRLLARREVAKIVLLMPGHDALRQRELTRLEAYLGALPPRVDVVHADLRLPRFGLSHPVWEDLAQSVDLALHCAERDTPDQNLDLARQANVRPVEGWLQLLARNPGLRLHHLSTIFVGGNRAGLLTEFDLDCGQTFRNAWERSKFEAEVRLWESRVSDRVTVYRASHVLGRAATGHAIELSCGYRVLARLANSVALPGDTQARIDFVPADFVAAAMVEMALSGANGTFHLASGWASSLPVPRAAEIAAHAVNRRRAPGIVPRGVAWPLKLAGGSAHRMTADCLHQGPVGDTYRADRVLAPLGIHRPPSERWIAEAAREAARRDWTIPEPHDWELPVAESKLSAASIERELVRKDPALREKRRHRVGEVDIVYRDFGEGEAVIFLHGLAGAASWDAVAHRVASGYRALIVETLGLGDSVGSESADFSLAAEAARVRGLLSALEIPAAHVVGNDLGGIVAQIFAVRWPHCVKSLTLSNCNSMSEWPPRDYVWRLVANPTPGSAQFGARMALRRLFHDRRMASPERIQESVAVLTGTRERRSRLRNFVRAFRNVDIESVRQLLGELDVSTMIVWGAEDRNASVSWAKTLSDTIPGVRRFELIPFAGGACPEERPDLFAERLLAFLGESTPAGEDREQAIPLTRIAARTP